MSLKEARKKNYAEQEQEVVIACQHMAGTQAHVLEVATVQHALAVFF